MCTIDLLVHVPESSDCFARVSEGLFEGFRHGKPCLVSDQGWFGEFSLGEVGVVRNDFLAVDLEKHLFTFLKSPQGLQKYGKIAQKGQETLASRSFEKYTSELLKVCRLVLEARAVSCNQEMVQKVSEEIGSWVKGQEAPIDSEGRISQAISFITL